VDAGAAKARESMEGSRKSFVDAATAARGNADAANKLADEIGLIPAKAEPTSASTPATPPASCSRSPIS
jgi:hypothetical protein